MYRSNSRVDNSRVDNSRVDTERMSQALAGIPFPAAKWQLIMRAAGSGADSSTSADLWALPAGSYHDLGAVLAALADAGDSSRTDTGLHGGPDDGGPVGHLSRSYRFRPLRSRPAPSTAGRVRPLG